MLFPSKKKVLAGLDPQLPKAGLLFENSRGCTKGSVRGSGRRAAIICFPVNNTEVTNNYLQLPMESLRHWATKAMSMQLLKAEGRHALPSLTSKENILFVSVFSRVLTYAA